MQNSAQKLKIVYVTPALYMAGGVERVLTLKANYFAEHFGYDITIILTEGKDKPLFYPLNYRAIKLKKAARGGFQRGYSAFLTTI